jgi:branched-chain amino acid transport system permease protein
MRSAARRAWPWAALLVGLGGPAWLWPQDWVLGYLAQTAALIVLALSYNLLLGATGLLSFGHAALAGLGAFAAAHVFARHGLPLPLLPLAGGLAGAGFGALFGSVATRRAGTAFAMITLGLGELVAAAAWSVPDWFGGPGGVPIDRARDAAWYGPSPHAYALIAGWCVLAALAMRAFTRTPFARLANAVRDNPARVAALGTDPRRVRFAMMVVAGFFAGIAGTLTLIDVEVASTESVGMLRSGAVLFAVVIGGTGTFFGPVVGAALLVFFSVFVASVSRAWLLYLGIGFVAVVVAAPDGLGGIWARHAARRAAGTRVNRPRAACALLAALAGVVASVIVVELGYAWRFAQDAGGVAALGPWRVAVDAPAGWCAALGAALLALALGLAARRAGGAEPAR